MVPSDFVRALPKVQLHCHLEGTVDAATFRALAQAHGIDIGARGQRPARSGRTRSRSFREFLLTFADVCRTLAEPDDFARIAANTRPTRARRTSATRRCSSRRRSGRSSIADLDVRAAVRAIREEFDAAERAGGPQVQLIFDLTRNFGLERAMETARQAVELAEFGVIGVGLGGDEANFPAGALRRAVRVRARARAADGRPRR